jgi:hypothetical protein
MKLKITLQGAPQSDHHTTELLTFVKTHYQEQVNRATWHTVVFEDGSTVRFQEPFVIAVHEIREAN